MDVHSIKSDLVAMEMELKYHDANDDDKVFADGKTPKASHSTRSKQSQHLNTAMEKILVNQERETISNYISLEEAKLFGSNQETEVR